MDNADSALQYALERLGRLLLMLKSNRYDLNRLQTRQQGSRSLKSGFGHIIIDFTNV